MRLDIDFGAFQGKMNGTLSLYTSSGPCGCRCMRCCSYPTSPASDFMAAGLSWKARIRAGGLSHTLPKLGNPGPGLSLVRHDYKMICCTEMPKTSNFTTFN